jgi:hypothetical protein
VIRFEHTYGYFSSSKENNPQVNFQHRFLDKGKDISSCVPIYVNKIPELDQTFFDLAKGQVNMMKPLTNEMVLNNSKI